MSERTRDQKTTWVSGLVAAACIGVSVLLQGGFFDLPICVVGLLACLSASVLWLRRPRRSQGLPLVPLLFVGLAVAYGISAAVAGFSLTTLGETGVWAACAGVALAASSQSLGERSRAFELLCWFGMATAVAGMLVAAGILPLEGGMVEDRLQFTFQYANAAAAWYASLVCLCLLGPNDRLRTLTFLPATALLLTQSGGATLVLMVVCVALGIRWARWGQCDRLRQALLQAVVSVALFCLFRLATPLGIACALALVLVALRAGEATDAWMSKAVGSNAKGVVVLACALVAGAAVLVAVVMPARVSDALASLVERTYHMRDGLTLWATSPVLGVGPNNWQYLYPYVQTAPYVAAVVHSSFVQLLVDAGAVGLALFVAACLAGLRGLWRSVGAREGDSWDLAALCAAAFLLGHSVIEFDLQFSSLSFLLALLLSGPTSPRTSAGEEGRLPAAQGGLAGALCALVCLPLALAGTLCSAASQTIDATMQASDYQACMRLYVSNPVLGSDAGVQNRYLAACFESQNYRRTVQAYGRMYAPSTQSVLYAAIAANVSGDAATGTEILVDRLQQTPYDVDLLEGAVRFAESFGIDQAQQSRFDAVVNASQQLIASSEVEPRR